MTRRGYAQGGLRRRTSGHHRTALGWSGPFLLGVAVGAAAALLLGAAVRRGDATGHSSRRAARDASGAGRGRRHHDVGERHVRAGARSRRAGASIRRARRSTSRSVRCRARWKRVARRRSRRAMSSSGASPKRRRRTTPASTSRGPAARRRCRRPQTSSPTSRPTAEPRRSATVRVARRPLFVGLRWTLRDYAKRVWDNAGEDNIFFLAGGIAFNILLAAVPFVLLLVVGARDAAQSFGGPDVRRRHRDHRQSAAAARGDEREPGPHAADRHHPHARRGRRLQRGRLHLVLDAPLRLAAERARGRVRHRDGSRDHRRASCSTFRSRSCRRCCSSPTPR